MESSLGVAVDQSRLADVRARYGVGRLMVFGGAGEATPGSDVDVLYEPLPGRRLRWEIEDLADELAEALGCPVDLVSALALHPRLAGGAG